MEAIEKAKAAALYNAGPGTPAPWVVESHPTKYADLRTYNVIAPQGWQENDGTFKRTAVATGLDSEADARLIAAAPNMLAALYSAQADYYVLVRQDRGQEDHDEFMTMLRIVEEAISQATGHAAKPPTLLSHT